MTKEETDAAEQAVRNTRVLSSEPALALIAEVRRLRSEVAEAGARELERAAEEATGATNGGRALVALLAAAYRLDDETAAVAAWLRSRASSLRKDAR